jgi:hypothetical protein
MSGFMQMLKADPSDWLLEKDNPSARYFALRDLLDLPEDAPEVRDAQQEIMRGGFVREILERQSTSEYIKGYPSFYSFKYKGLVWQLITLAELGAVCDEQIKEQCKYLFANSQELTDGGFSASTAIKTGGGRISEVIPCLTGNMVWCLINFGYLDDPRLHKGIEWLCRFMRFNDGVESDPQVPPYNHYEMCWGKHTCHMGVVKALKAMSAVPEAKRTPEIKALIEKASEFILIHHVHKQSHNLSKTSKPGWLKFGYPLMYQTDALEILDILTSLGIKDSRMDEAIALVLSKQNESGRWLIENTYNTPLVPLERKGTESKLVTLRAMRVLKRYFSE